MACEWPPLNPVGNQSSCCNLTSTCCAGQCCDGTNQCCFNDAGTAGQCCSNSTNCCNGQCCEQSLSCCATGCCNTNKTKEILIIAGSVISGLILFTALGLLLWCLFCTRVGKAKVIDNARPRDLQQDKDNEYTLMDEKTEGYNY